MITLKYTFSELKDKLLEYGFNLLEYKSTTKLIAIDNKGYKYKINLCNLIDGKQPNKFMKNPFAIDNFKLYLKNNYPDYELLDNEYINCKTKMRFICHKHLDKGIQYNTVANIYHSHHACLYCGCSDVWEKKRTTIKTMKERCDKLGLQFVNRTSKNNECYVNYICPIHEEVGVQVSSWTHFKEFKKGCPHCSKMSIGENKIYNYLSNNKVKFYKEYIFNDCKHIKKLKFDFYIPDLNLVIEYNGQHHYKPLKHFGGEDNYNKVVERDKIKMDYCNENNINMLVIPYWEFKNIEKILEPLIKDVK